MPSAAYGEIVSDIIAVELGGNRLHVKTKRRTASCAGIAATEVYKTLMQFNRASPTVEARRCAKANLTR